MTTFAVPAELNAFLRNQQVYIFLVKRSTERIGMGRLPPLTVDIFMAARAKRGGGKCGRVNESSRFRLCLAGQERTSAERIVIGMRSFFISRWTFIKGWGRVFVVRRKQNASASQEQDSR